MFVFKRRLQKQNIKKSTYTKQEEKDSVFLADESFMDKDFLLSNETAKALYHECALKMPIIDFHCHLLPKEIAENKPYANMTEIWLKGDHYKWRAMRWYGVDEEFITGNKSDLEKFVSYAKVLPFCIGNPLYHWTHLELKRYFVVDDCLQKETAEAIWHKCNKMLKEKSFLPQTIMEKSLVKIACTTDDPIDNLSYHEQIAKNNQEIKVLPTFRPDKYFLVNDEFAVNIEKLAISSSLNIESIKKLMEALACKMDYFAQRGCKISDHALDYMEWELCSERKADKILQKILLGKKVEKRERNRLQTFLLNFLVGEYQKRGWVMQLHIGAMRNCNTKMGKLLGKDTGFDAINDCNYAKKIAKMFDDLSKQNILPKTIIYNLNTQDNEMLASIIGCFQDNALGKIQLGPAWWFADQKNGIEKQLLTLANFGVLGSFVGMLTDSRSILSYTRHEYFRRILCNLIGSWVENGEYPKNWQILQKIIEDICYYNAKEYFAF